jgi:hypothetical protein
MTGLLFRISVTLSISSMLPLGSSVAEASAVITSDLVFVAMSDQSDRVTMATKSLLQEFSLQCLSLFLKTAV